MKREVNLIGGFYKDNSLTFSAQDTVNWLPVPAESDGARSAIKLRGLPGLRGVIPPIVAENNLAISGNAPDTAISSPYSFAYTITGGQPPYNVTISSGALPPGLSISLAGVISGATGATVANYTFTVRVEDSASNVRTLNDAINVASGVNVTALSIWNKLIDWFSLETAGSTQVGLKAGISLAYRTNGAGPHGVTVVSSPIGNGIAFTGTTSTTNTSGYSSDWGAVSNLSYNSECSVIALARFTGANVLVTGAVAGFKRFQSAAPIGAFSTVVGIGANNSEEFVLRVGNESSAAVSAYSSQPASGSWALCYSENYFDGVDRKNGGTINSDPIGNESIRANSSFGAALTSISIGGENEASISPPRISSGLDEGVEVSEVAFFNAKLTQTERDYLFNSGSFRTFTQLKTDAGIP